MPLVLDLHITHERFGSSSDPSINGHSHYPHDLDRSLNETATDKIRQYRADYINRPSHDITFMTSIASTSGSLHSEFVLLLFLQAHWETDHFLADTGVQLVKTNQHFRRAVFSSQFKSKVGHILVKVRLLTSSLSLGVPGSHTTQCM